MSDQGGQVADVMARLYQQKLRTSRRLAEQEHGKAHVAMIHAWAEKKADEDPHFNQAMLAHPDPYEAAHEAHAREQVLEVVKPEDLDDFQAWRKSRASAQTKPAQPERATSPARGVVPKHPDAEKPGEAFANAFSR